MTTYAEFSALLKDRKNNQQLAMFHEHAAEAAAAEQWARAFTHLLRAMSLVDVVLTQALWCHQTTCWEHYHKDTSTGGDPRVAARRLLAYDNAVRGGLSSASEERGDSVASLFTRNSSARAEAVEAFPNVPAPQHTVPNYATKGREARFPARGQAGTAGKAGAPTGRDMCWDWQRGSCSRSSMCRFEHVGPAGGSGAQAKAQQKTAGPPGPQGQAAAGPAVSSGEVEAGEGAE